ncbi:MAG: tripartite tricarboxylate transporter permease [Candidatus Heteroscillospira sp.]|jgi:putative tricarboxylic transport membrane protein
MILDGLLAVTSPLCIFLMLAGTVIGIAFGSVPGLTANMAVALCLPLTYKMSAEVGMAFLISLYVGGISGGLIAAILINIPGTPASVATCFDGSPLAKKGEAGKALGVGICSSVVGTLLSIVALMFIAPTLAKLALKFGPYEYFAVSIFSLTMISSLISDSILKGLTAAVLGVLVSLFGIAPTGGTLRFTFGIQALQLGFSTLPVLIGLFAVSEVLSYSMEVPKVNNMQIMEYKIKGFGFTAQEAKSQIWNCLRSSLIGIGIGILPGIGGGTSNVIAYSVAKQSSKYPEKFGTGIIDGVVASEAANNASVGGALIPLLTLGIPGDAVTAILLGGLVMKGINPGPLLFTNSGKFVYGIFFALIISTIMMFVIEFFGIRMFVNVLKVPKYYLLPIVMALCCVGTFGVNNRIFDVWASLIFGVVGFLLNRFKFPVSPFILGFLLGGVVEQNLIRSIQYSTGSVIDAYMHQPIAMVFLVISIGLVTFKSIKAVAGKKAREKANT